MAFFQCWHKKRLKLRLIGNRTSCRPIRSVIILVIKQIGLPLRGRPVLLITRINYRPNRTPLRAFLHGVGDPGLVGLVSFVLCPPERWSPTPCKQRLSPFTITNRLLVVSITDSYKKKRISFKKDRKKNRWWKSVNTSCCLQWNAFQKDSFKTLFLKVSANP